nr:hypothetical protein [Gammaproteobacteria bacterium]
LETGNMVLRGDEKIKPGTYIELEHGNLNPQYYTQNVSHVFVVLGTYTTEVDFIRGTGFSERLETPNYLQEYSRGAYG